MKRKLLLASILTVGLLVRADRVYQCRFESSDDVARVVNGVSGTCSGGVFGVGVSGNALYVTPRTSVAHFRLPAGTLGEKGKIEFWAKLGHSRTWYGDYGDPNFFSILDDQGTRLGHLEFTANNGSGSSGLYASLPGGISCVSGTGWSYATILGAGQTSDWHRYTLAWNEDGIDTLANRPVMAVLVDGKMVASMPLSGFSKDGFAAAMGQSLTLHFCYHDTTRGVSPFWLDELSIWNGRDADNFEIPAPEVSVGQYCKLDLVSDLRVTIPTDYVAGDKATVKIEGLAAGLKLVTTPQKANLYGVTVVTNILYSLEGVPKEAIDTETNPMYVRVKIAHRDRTKTETLAVLKLQIREMDPVALPDAWQGSNYVACVTKFWPTADASWTIKGLPSGLRYTTKAVTTRNRDKTVTTNALPFEIYGAPTKAGVFTLTVSHVKTVDKKKHIETETATLAVRDAQGELPSARVQENAGFLGLIDWSVDQSVVTIRQGVIQTNWQVKVDAAAKVTVSGLPPGLRLAQNRKAKCWTLSGTPTKVGNFVVTLKTTLNGVTKVERIAVIVEPNEWTGTWYAVPEEEGYAVSWSASVSVAAGGSVKLILTEGTTNVTAKGVRQSRIVKTTVSAKNLDAGGETVTLTVPKDKKDASAQDRICVIDFTNNSIQIAGEERVADLVRSQPLAFDAPETAITVIEEAVVGEEEIETAVFAYLTVTYNSKRGLAGIQGKLGDGTVVRTTSPTLQEGVVAPFLVTDKSKNVISIALQYQNGQTTTFAGLKSLVYVNGQRLLQI